MKKILISVEGQTEEQFISRLLQSLFPVDQCCLVPVILKPRRESSGHSYKGGIVSYARIKNEIKKLLNDTSALAVSTMYDYYGLPRDFPGKDALHTDWSASQKVSHLQYAFAQDIDDPRFVPYLSLHEFEALLFSDVAKMIDYFKSKGVQDTSSLQRLAQRSPEDINLDNPPSHRLKSVWAEYREVSHGIPLAEQIGVDTMMQKCPHFRSWVDTLKQLCLNG